jgi:hypothetical protein
MPRKANIPTTAVRPATANARLAKRLRCSGGRLRAQLDHDESGEADRRDDVPDDDLAPEETDRGALGERPQQCDKTDGQGELAGNVELAAVGSRRVLRQQRDDERDHRGSDDDPVRAAPTAVLREQARHQRGDRGTDGQEARPQGDGLRPRLPARRNGGDHRQRNRVERARADAGDGLADDHEVHGVCVETQRSTDHDEHSATEEELLTAEQVADHPEGQLEDHHARRERGADPGELGPVDVEDLLEGAVESTGQ